MSCRFQPDYRGDSMYRGDADYRTEPCLDFTYDLLDGNYDPTPTVPGLTPLDANIPIVCDTPIIGVEISNTSGRSFYRQGNDIVANRAYKARRFEAAIDDEGEFTVHLENVAGFSPYVIVNRSEVREWRGALDSNGDFVFNATVDDVGPITIEITTVNRRELGRFDIEFQCHSDVQVLPTRIWVDRATLEALIPSFGGVVGDGITTGDYNGFMDIQGPQGPPGSQHYFQTIFAAGQGSQTVYQSPTGVWTYTQDIPAVSYTATFVRNGTDPNGLYDVTNGGGIYPALWQVNITLTSGL